jgi:putative tricarboxylic transport membrane protein
MIIHGVRPGPLLMVEQPQFVYDVVAMCILATIGILFFGLFLIRPMLMVLRIPRTIIMPIIFVLCVIGSYAIAQRLFDVWTMLGFGIAGFFLRQLGYHMAPFVLGIVLGDILDKSLRRGLVLSDGSLEPFFTRPICLVLWLIIAASVVLQIPQTRAAASRAAGVLVRVLGREARPP